MTQITADVIADSVNPDGDRVTSYLLTYPRFILAEINTHRAFSRNTASSRAVPVDKVIRQVMSAPAEPVRWGKAGPGMQDHGELDPDAAASARLGWHAAAQRAAMSAGILAERGVHKQVVNRVLEPYVTVTTLLTGTDFGNFFALRVNAAAQPELQRLAYLMLKAYVAGRPVPRAWGEWHVPFGDRMPPDLSDAQRLAVAVARAARVSYVAHDGDHSLAADLALYDRLASAGHWSPFEHQAQAMRDGVMGVGRWANFHGWRQLRWTFDGECRNDVDLPALLAAYERDVLGVGAEGSAAVAAGEVSPC